MQGKWLLLGNILYALTQWLLISYVSHIYSPEEVGEYFFALSLSAPIFLLFSLKAPVLVVTKYARAEDRDEVYFSRSIFSLVSVLSVFLVWVLFFDNEVSVFTILSILLYKASEHYDDVLSSYYQYEMKFKNVFYVKVARGFGYIACVILSSLFFLSFEHSLFFGTSAYLSLWLLTGGCRLGRLGNGAVLRGMSSFGLSMGASSAISSLSVMGSRIYIGIVLGKEMLAVYGSIGYVSVAISMVVSAIAQYYLPYFVTSRNDRVGYLRKVYESQALIFILGTLGIAGIYFAGELFLTLVYGSFVASFSDSLYVMLLATIAKASSALMGTSVTATQTYSFQLKFSIVSFIFVILLLPCLVDLYGVVGAFAALLVVSVIELLLYMLFFPRYISSIFND